ncbi:MAG: 3-hydroxyanthranilate 3,4-dioxygenase [Planctomycetes bacterium]|nr:3-hydroxyanthranilate 3,4-dioxygenase [Planctomycetota bacterium]
MLRAPLNFKTWIDEHRDLLKPPVGNKLVFEDTDFIVMVVGSNTRRDFHVNEGEELFYQVEGNIVLKVQDGGAIRDIAINEGDMFLLPPRVPHSPRRPTGTVGLVIEKKRAATEQDGFQWYCEQCGHKLHEEFAHISHIVTQLPPLLARFYGDEAKRTCAKCGTRFPDPVKVT